MRRERIAEHILNQIIIILIHKKMETIYKSLEANQDRLESMKQKMGDEIRFKAVGNVLLANVTGAGSTFLNTGQMLPTVVPPIYANNLLDYFPKVVVNSSSLILADQVASTEEGTISTTAEGTAKDKIDFNLVGLQKSFTKYAAYIKVSKEMLDDIPYINDAINRTLSRRIKDIIGKDFLTAIVAATGKLSSALVAGSNATTLTECIPAIYGGMYALTGHRMNLWLLNEANYSSVFSMPATGFSHNEIFYHINKVNVEPCTVATSGSVFALETELFPLYVYKDMDISIGYETADFINNMVTIRAESRVAWNLTGEALLAYFKDTITNAIARF